MLRIKKNVVAVSVALIATSLFIVWGFFEVKSHWTDSKQESSTIKDGISKGADSSDALAIDRRNLNGGTTAPSSEQCNLSNPFENNEQLTSFASYSIRNSIQGAIRKGLGLDGVDFISHKTGLLIPLSRFEYIRQQNFNFIKKYPNETIPLFGGPSWLEKMSSESLQLVIRAASINKEDVLEKIRSGALTNETFYAFDEYKTTLLGFLFTKTSWFSIDDVEDLIDAGYSPTISDLAFFTSKGASLDAVKNMWRHAEGSATKIHKYPPVFESLASIALFHGNFELLEFWLAQNSPINPDPLGVSALKKFLFAKKQRSYLPEEEAFILNQIAQSPLSQSDYDLITSLFINYLTSDSIDNLKVYTEKELGEHQQGLVLEYVEQIADIVLEPLDSKPTEKYCINQYVINSVGYIFDNLLAQQRHEEQTQLPKPFLSPEVSSLLTSVVQSIKEDENEITKKFSEKAKMLREERMAQLTEEDNVLIEEVLAAANMNKWDLALQLLEAMDGNKQDALDTLMSIALTKSPEPALLLSLIDKGAKVPSGAYMQLLFTNNIEAAKALIPYGLNIEDPILAGGDVIKDVVKFGTPEMLEVFLRNGAVPNLAIEGMDAVDILLERFSLKDDDAVFLQHLMQNSVDVEQSHIAFVYQLARNSPAEYQYIESRYPRLTAFTQQKDLQ